MIDFADKTSTSDRVSGEAWRAHNSREPSVRYEFVGRDQGPSSAHATQMLAPIRVGIVEGAVYEFTAPITLDGEIFYVELDQQAGVVYLRHPEWSLMGSGATLAEAEIDLRSEATELAEVLRHASDLDEGALALLDFALRSGVRR